jgi:hypothetical protein
LRWLTRFVASYGVTSRIRFGKLLKWGLSWFTTPNAKGVVGCQTIATEVLMDKNPRTGLAEKAYQLLLVGVPLITAIVELISKVVNYNDRPVSKL